MSSSKQATFGGRGTQRKLEILAKYADFYSTALKDMPFTLHYFDAFAGTGNIPLGSEMPLIEGVLESASFISGSATRALRTSNPFDRYVFVEKGPARAAELEVAIRSADRERASLATVERGDANDALVRFCATLGCRDRALVFLDPFGNQVDWSTLEAVADTGRVDLWYLFPAWIGVARQITNSGVVLPQSERSIDRMFGPHDWRAVALKTEERTQANLFEPPQEEVVKIATAESMTKFMIRSMKSIFRGGVLDSWAPVGKDGRHWFSLLFACANPSHKANSLAVSRAKQIMSRS